MDGDCGRIRLSRAGERGFWAEYPVFWNGHDQFRRRLHALCVLRLQDNELREKREYSDWDVGRDRECSRCFFYYLVFRADRTPSHWRPKLILLADQLSHQKILKLRSPVDVT